MTKVISNVGNATQTYVNNVTALNPITVAVTVGALVIAGKWARGQSPNIDNAVGVAGVALGLAVLEQMNTKLAAAFGGLILVSVAAVHLPTIVKAAGFGSGNAEPSKGD